MLKECDWLKLSLFLSSKKMPPSFYSSACPVFSVAWLGNRNQEENEAYVLYSGGGGSTKSGIKNQIVVARLKPENKNSAPSFDQVCAVETEDRICSTFHTDQPRENGKAQLVAMGLGNMLMVYGIASTHELVAVSAGVNFKGEKEGSLVDMKSIAFDKKSGKTIASGDEDGVIRIIRLHNVEKVLKSLVVFKPSNNTDELPKIKFDEKVVEFTGHTEAILSLQFSSSGSLLCSSSRDGTCRIWHVESGRELCVIQATANMPAAYAKDKRVLKQMCRVACFSSDEKSMYTLQSAARGSSHVTKWTLQEDKKKKNIECVSSFTVQIASCPVTTLELSSCQQLLVTGDTKGVVSVFDANTLRKVKSYEGHQLPVSALCLSTESCSILTGSGDKTIIIGSVEAESRVPMLRSLLFWSILFLIIAWLVQNGQEHLPLLSLNEALEKIGKLM